MRVTIPELVIIVCIAAMPVYFMAPHPARLISASKAFAIAKSYQEAPYWQAVSQQADKIILTTNNPRLMTVFNWRGVNYVWR